MYARLAQHKKPRYAEYGIERFRNVDRDQVTGDPEFRYQDQNQNYRKSCVNDIDDHGIELLSDSFENGVGSCVYVHDRDQRRQQTDIGRRLRSRIERVSEFFDVNLVLLLDNDA